MMLWLALACSGGNEPLSPDAGVDSTPTEPTADTAQVAPGCPTFGDAEAVGFVQEPGFTELSGLTRSGLLWAHNDSGTPVLLGLSDAGAVVQRVSVAGGIVADWEDITRRGDHLWVGDVGDNLSVRSIVHLYEMPVPATAATEVTARRVQVQWPDGPVDCEAVLADPITGDLLLMSKVLDGMVTVARLPDPDLDRGDDVVTLEEVATVQFGNDGVGNSSLVTGADLSPDGRFLVVRTYVGAWAFPRIPGEPWADTFARDACEVPTGSEGQGEAITWDSAGVWTVSEGDGVPLHFTSVTE